MNTTATKKTTINKKIAFAALAAPVLAAIAVGIAAPAWAASESVEPSEPSEVSEVRMPAMGHEQQEPAGPTAIDTLNHLHSQGFHIDLDKVGH